MSTIHAYLSTNLAGVLSPDELLRAEWVGRVGALDLYVHELVAQNMLAAFNGTRPHATGSERFQIGNSTLVRIKAAVTPTDAAAAFDLEVRSRLATLTYQHPEKIAEGVRLISNCELWNEIALLFGASAKTKSDEAKELKKKLLSMVDRRNKIAHEGDFSAGYPRVLVPIASSDLLIVSNFVKDIVHAIDSLV